MTAFQPSELLLEHAGGLRRLARALLHDAEEAEDALQETFALALERAPERLERPGAWLRQVLRSVVHKRLRGADRREAREFAVARAERGGDTFDLITRGELLQRVVDAVQSLEPKLREVVLLRHFEGLPPRRIARDTDTKLATVNGRLQRAHAQLRSKLDEDGEGRWIPGLLICFGWKRETPVIASTVAAGVIAVTGSLLFKCSLAAAAFATTAWLWPTRHAAALEAPDHLRPSVVVADLRASTRTMESSAERQSLENPADASAPPFIDEGPRDFRLVVRAVDVDDLPIEGAELHLAPPGREANLVGRTNRDGLVEAAWLGRDRIMEIDWALRDGRSGTHLARVKLVAGRTYEFAGSLLEGDEDASFDPEARNLRSELRAERIEGGLLRFISDAAQIEEIRDHDESDDSRSREEQIAEGGWSIEGRVFLENGSPQADVLVGCGSTLGRITRKRTDEHGNFRLTGYGEGRVVLRAGGGDDGRAESMLEVRDGGTYLWDAVLERGTELCGSVIFFDGNPAANWLVLVDSAGHGEAFADQTRTDADGRFCIPNCPSTKLRVRARPLEAQCSSPWAEQEGVLAAAGHLPLLVPYEQAARLQLPGMESSALRELRLVHEASGTISWVRLSGSNGPQLDGLPPGEYRLESLAGSRGGMRTAPFFVFAEEDASLYPWLVPLACELELSGMPQGESQRVRFERLDGPVRIDLPAELSSGPPRPWQLPPGDYRMHVAGHPAWTTDVYLVEGQILRVELPPEEEAGAGEREADER